MLSACSPAGGLLLPLQERAAIVSVAVTIRIGNNVFKTCHSRRRLAPFQQEYRVLLPLVGLRLTQAGLLRDR
jgi:hypothetical protein